MTDEHAIPTRQPFRITAFDHRTITADINGRVCACDDPDGLLAGHRQLQINRGGFAERAPDGRWRIVEVDPLEQGCP
jgi:hypothetical protein